MAAGSWPRCHSHSRCAAASPWSSDTAARGARLHHPDFAARPGSRGVDGMARPEVVGLSRLEQAEHVLGAHGRPQREKVVIGIGEGAASPDRDEPRVTDRRQDHPVRLRFGSLRSGSRPSISPS
jgi:hypothetical protein